MIKGFGEKWYKNKDKLEDYIKNHGQSDYCSYNDLVKLVIHFIINDENNDNYDNYDEENLIEINDGDYQGTLIFITHLNTYQPDEYEYIQTFVNYGSCSYCDTLLGISNYEDGKPSESQVEDYMMLCLHLLENFKYLFKEE